MGPTGAAESPGRGRRWLPYWLLSAGIVVVGAAVCAAVAEATATAPLARLA